MLEPRVPKVTIFGIVALLVVGVGTIALAMGTFGRRLSAPFHLLPTGSLTSAALTGGGLNSSETPADSNKDTDHDGLSDAAEIQIYGTSPFLDDADSDGESDRFEIEHGTDPNCPKGVDCRATAFSTDRGLQTQTQTQALYDASIVSKLSEKGMAGFTDATSIRNLLRQSGMSEEVLKQFDDETLVKLVAQGSVGAQSPSPGFQPPSPAERGEGEGSSQKLPENPSVESIRQLLTAAGLDKEVLAKFSDEQLVKLYQDTLKEVNNK